jgi:hypothetical protein
MVMWSKNFLFRSFKNKSPAVIAELERPFKDQEIACHVCRGGQGIRAWNCGQDAPCRARICYSLQLPREDPILFFSLQVQVEVGFGILAQDLFPVFVDLSFFLKPRVSAVAFAHTFPQINVPEIKIVIK